MSWDKQIDQKCPHKVMCETLFVENSGALIRPLRPISSQTSVEVVLNGIFNVPRGGVYQPTSLLSTTVGPISVRKNVNDIIKLWYKNTEQVITVTPGENRPVQRISDELNSVARGASFFEQSGRLGIRTQDSGPLAVVATRFGSTFLSSVGLPLNRVLEGVLVVPGWSLVEDPTVLSDRPRRNILFDTPLKGFHDFVEINYVTVKQECRRCGGTGIENDWRYLINGDVVQAVDEALLLQEIQKIVFTLKGSNTFHDWYGTTVVDMIGKKLTADNFVQNLIVSDIKEAFRNWQSIKKKQETVVGQPVSDREYPFALLGVSLKQSKQDPTVIFVTVTIQNRSFEPIVVERGIRLPSNAALVDTNVAGGSIRQSLSDFVLAGLDHGYSTPNTTTRQYWLYSKSCTYHYTRSYQTGGYPRV